MVGVILENSSLVIDYQNDVIDYTVVFWRVVTFHIWNLNFNSNNRLHTLCNRLQALKFKFKFLKVVLKCSKTSDNRLQALCNQLQAFKNILKHFKILSESFMATGNRLPKSK